MPKTIDLSRSHLPGSEEREIQRFVEALRKAMIRNRCSERRLAADLGITIGTTQKYLRRQIHPLKVGTGINSKLASLLGITLDDLVRYYETGEERSGVSFEQVLSWVNSEAGVEHLGSMLSALAGVGGSCGKTAEPEAVQPFTWPLEELDQAGVSKALRERMGLTEEALDALVNRGEFDDELVEAFAVATNLDELEVRKAFEKRVPIPPV
jgi:DNA-binding Xre family transcriptional regulator